MKVRRIGISTKLIIVVLILLIVSDLVIGVAVYSKESTALRSIITNSAMEVSSVMAAEMTDRGYADQVIGLEAGMEETEIFKQVYDLAMLVANSTGVEFVYTITSDGMSSQFQMAVAGEDVMTIGSESTYQPAIANAVNGVTFDINEREVFGVIGVSGGGKTTLSRMIAGIYEPTSGTLEVRVGDDWVDMKKPGFENRGRAKQYIGLLHQEYDLYPHRTIIDNLTDAIGLEFPKELAVRKAMITLRMAGFTEKKARDVLNRYPPSLSEGEKHRVALAQILIREPRIILLDEPTGTMDPITKVDVKHSILHAREEMDETFVIVSHDMEFIRDVCDRCMFMRDGEIVAIGETQEILKHLTEAELITMHEAVTRERERVESGVAKKATLSGGAPEGEVDENAIHKTTDEMFEM